MQTFHPLPAVAKWEHMLRLCELDKPTYFHKIHKQADIHLNSNALSSEKVNLTLWDMSHTIAASLSTLMARGEDHCTMCN
jgi:hypothetical protein